MEGAQVKKMLLARGGSGGAHVVANKSDAIAAKLQPLLLLFLYCFACINKTLHNKIIVNKNVGVNIENAKKLEKSKIIKISIDIAIVLCNIPLWGVCSGLNLVCRSGF